MDPIEDEFVAEPSIDVEYELEKLALLIPISDWYDCISLRKESILR